MRRGVLVVGELVDVVNGEQRYLRRKLDRHIQTCVSRRLAFWLGRLARVRGGGVGGGCCAALCVVQTCVSATLLMMMLMMALAAWGLGALAGQVLTACGRRRRRRRGQRFINNHSTPYKQRQTNHNASQPCPPPSLPLLLTKRNQHSNNRRALWYTALEVATMSGLGALNVWAVARLFRGAGLYGGKICV